MPDGPSPALAFVATRSGKLPDLSSIEPPRKKSLFSFFKKQPPKPEWKDEKFIVHFGESIIAVALMPAPIPWAELEGPCATAWWWPDAGKHMKKATHHFIVTVMGGDIPPVERRILLSNIVSAVADGADTVGIYWGEGTLVHKPSEFIEQVSDASPDNIPGRLWIDVRVEKNPDGSFRCFTTGMKPLGFREIEVVKSKLDPSELMEFIGNTSCYIVNNRMEIPDGDTMGRTASEKYKVKHTKSMFKRPDVMQLVMQ